MAIARRSTGGQVTDSSAGIAADAAGNPALDPSRNVSALSEAGHKRQDDMRKLNNKFLKAEIRRLDAKLKCADETAELREKHNKEMRKAEKSRLNSIRQVDVTAVKTEADRSVTAIQTLAATTATNAENLRTALNTTAASIAKSNSDTVSEITTRIAALEKSSYEGAGKERIADPMMTELVAEMKNMRQQQSEGAGRQKLADPMMTEMMLELKSMRESRSEEAGKQRVADPMMADVLAEVKSLRESRAGWSGGIGAILGIATVVGVVTSVMTFALSRSPTVAPPPQVIYVPAPSPPVSAIPPQRAP